MTEDPLGAIRALEVLITERMAEIGLELGEDFSVCITEEQDTLTFTLNVLPGAVITPDDFDQAKYDDEFKDIVDFL